MSKLGPTALKLRPDLIEGVESSLYFRFHIWPWQLVAKMATKVVCQTLKTGQRYRFLAKKEIGVIEASTSNVCNISFNNAIELVRCYRSFSAAGPYMASPIGPWWSTPAARISGASSI